MTTIDPKALGKVGVLFGGKSAEREVSLMSGSGVLAALQSQGVDAHAFDPGQQSLAELAAAGFDRVFIALHGRFGEDGTIQGALELLGIPYTGSGVMACAVGMDKITTKKLWQQQGLPTPDYAVLTPDSDLQAVAATLGLPAIMKPPHEGSTIGITKVEQLDALQAAYEAAARFDDEVLCEQFVSGREFTVAVLGAGKDARALPIVEIRAPQGNYDYNNKYFTDDTQYLCPAPLDAALTERMQRYAVEAYRAVGCEGWGRVDVLLRESDQQPFLLEVNTSPGMTGHSLVPMAARALGISYEQLCLEILATARLKTVKG
ncbi:D-alanine--D-alanine ligase [Massilia sp. TS11]|uniref:D-alanine--D-alanine ligase n=1 Tax=Massilia sp. TS11 TaxID=2908003 RepID=UPI001EDC2CC3|nr:D-alanine--D-alanine ligase [Massilia sp. TS11]MCG2585320.1 D-alanine--D-alanine ligase [Massilia sp. TS11]